jgi:hypothetical protein
MSMGFMDQEHMAKDIFSHMLELWQEEQRHGSAAAMKAVEEFVNFSKEYLATNRPMQSFHPEANIGTVLTNNVRVVLSPLAAELPPGDMAPVPGDLTINQGSVPLRGKG